MRRLPCTSYAAPRRGGQVVQIEAPNGSHSGSIPDPATDAYRLSSNRGQRSPTCSDAIVNVGGCASAKPAWRFGLSVRDYPELEADERSPTFET